MLDGQETRSEQKNKLHVSISLGYS